MMAKKVKQGAMYTGGQECEVTLMDVDNTRDLGRVQCSFRLYAPADSPLDGVALSDGKRKQVGGKTLLVLDVPLEEGAIRRDRDGCMRAVRIEAAAALRRMASECMRGVPK